MLEEFIRYDDCWALGDNVLLLTCVLVMVINDADDERGAESEIDREEASELAGG